MSRIENALPISRIKTQNTSELEHTTPAEQSVGIVDPETLATLEQQVAAIQQLFGATGIAVGVGSDGAMRCVLQCGVGAPALGLDLCQVPVAADAISSNLAVIGTAESNSQIAVPAVGGHEPALLLILVANETDAFDRADLSLLYACVDHVADLVTATASARAATTDRVRLRLIENSEPAELPDESATEFERWDLPNATSAPSASCTGPTQSADDFGIYFDAPADAPKALLACETPDDGWTLFDDLSNEGAKQSASSAASEISVHLQDTPAVQPVKELVAEFGGAWKSPAPMAAVGSVSDLTSPTSSAICSRYLAPGACCFRRVRENCDQPRCKISRRRCVACE